MGEAFTATADDAFAAYWNPAGLPRLSSATAALMYNRQFQGLDQQYLSLVGPLRSNFGAGVSMTRLGTDAVPSYNASGAAAGSVSASDLALAAAFGARLAAPSAGRPGISVGLQSKWIRENLAGVSAEGMPLRVLRTTVDLI